MGERRSSARTMPPQFPGGGDGVNKEVELKYKCMLTSFKVWYTDLMPTQHDIGIWKKNNITMVCIYVSTSRSM